MNKNFDQWIKESAPGIRPSQMKKSVHLVMINARLREREKLYRSKLKAQKRGVVWALVVIVLLGGGFFAELKTDEYSFNTKSLDVLPDNEMYVEFAHKKLGFNVSNEIEVSELLDLEMRLEAWIGDPLEFNSYQMPGAELWCVAKDFLVEGEAARYWGHSRERADINAMSILPFLLEESPALISEVNSGILQPFETRQVKVDGVVFETRVYEYTSLKFGKIIYMEGLPVG